MAEEASTGGTGSGARPRPRLPRVSDLLDVTDEMITFADKYQQVWEHEAKATVALGEFLLQRSQSLRSQVELMRMGSGAFRRYSDWSESLFGVRPETFMRGMFDQMERMNTRVRTGKRDDAAAP